MRLHGILERVIASEDTAHGIFTDLTAGRVCSPQAERDMCFQSTDHYFYAHTSIYVSRHQQHQAAQFTKDTEREEVIASAHDTPVSDMRRKAVTLFITTLKRAIHQKCS